MDISVLYDINDISIDLEKALMIDGPDYAERDFSVILNNVRQRIIRQYQLDLTNAKIYDESLYIGKQRSSASMLVENISIIHARLCGYLQIARYSGEIIIKPINVNYLGIQQKSIRGVLQLCMRRKTVESAKNGMLVFESRIGSLSNCLEKKMFLLMTVSYELGFYEIVAAIAEILYLGDKV